MTPQIANIGPRERARRRRAGWIMLAAGLAVAAGLVAADVDRWWRLLLFLPFWGSALGFLQARART